MREVPERARRLAEERAGKRAEGDFAAADGLRDRIREMGFEVRDTPEGVDIEPTMEEVRRLRPGQVESLLREPSNADFSVHWVVQGWPEDVLRGIESFRRFQGERDVQHVVVDAAGTEPSYFPPYVEVIPLEDDFGWAADRNAGLRRSRGRIVVVADGSIEAVGDVFPPLEEALADPSVGVVGPFGLVTDDLHEFRESGGVGEDRRVDAVEGYLMAFRRETLEEVGFFDEKFKFYRIADVEYSFRLMDRGYKAVVVTLQVERREHRMWESTSPTERERLSKRNYYRFLDRWRGRIDLTVGGRN